MCSNGEGITIHPDFSVMLCVCLMCSSGEGITIHPELLSDAVVSVMLCLSYVFQW